MDTPSDIDKRLTDLEIKASLNEDTVDRLNEIVIRQQDQIDLLLREVGRLVREGQPGNEPSVGGAREEVPPHY